MATRYVFLNTRAAALAQSADWWTKILGRLKFPQDVTEWLARVINHPSNSAALIEVSDQVYANITPKLTSQEKTTLDNALLARSDPIVIGFLGAP